MSMVSIWCQHLFKKIRFRLFSHNIWCHFILDGILSLQAQGCFDEPTLTTAQEKSDTLAFVHIVADLNSTNSSGSNSTNSSQSDACEKQEKAYHLSDSQDSSDEEEFIG